LKIENFKMNLQFAFCNLHFSMERSDYVFL